VAAVTVAQTLVRQTQVAALAARCLLTLVQTVAAVLCT
jgi:hypothetical protein